MEVLRLMTDNLTLFASICVLVWVVSYAWWVRMRDMLFRQELFAIRDRLWDVARRLDAFDDEAYREARERLNNTIRISRWITIPAVAFVSDFKGEQTERKRSENEELQEAIDNAYQEAARYICHHLMRHTISGLTVLVLAFVARYVIAGRARLCGIRKYLAGTVGRPLDVGVVVRWLSSPIPNEMANDERAIGDGHPA